MAAISEDGTRVSIRVAERTPAPQQSTAQETGAGRHAPTGARKHRRPTTAATAQGAKGSSSVGGAPGAVAGAEPSDKPHRAGKAARGSLDAAGEAAQLIGIRIKEAFRIFGREADRPHGASQSRSPITFSTMRPPVFAPYVPDPNLLASTHGAQPSSVGGAPGGPAGTAATTRPATRTQRAEHREQQMQRLQDAMEALPTDDRALRIQQLQQQLVDAQDHLGEGASPRDFQRYFELQQVYAAFVAND